MASSEAAEIECLLRTGERKRARALIRQQLRRRMDEWERHFWYARLAKAYSDDGDQAKALPYAERALNIAPACAMAAEVWADVLVRSGREEEAIAMYEAFVDKGPAYIASLECGEGIAWARALVADSLYSIAWAYQRLGRPREGIPFMRRHLRARARGWRSRVNLRSARKLLAELGG